MALVRLGDPAAAKKLLADLDTLPAEWLPAAARVIACIEESKPCALLEPELAARSRSDDVEQALAAASILLAWDPERGFFRFLDALAASSVRERDLAEEYLTRNRAPELTWVMRRALAREGRAFTRDRLPWLMALGVAATLLRIATLAWLAESHASRAAATVSPVARRALLERAWDENSRSPDHAVALGAVRLETGDAAGAERVLLTSVALRPSIAALIALGQARSTLGEPAAARRAFERAVALAPTSFRAHVSLASALLAAGDLDGAERHLAVARPFYPHHPRSDELAERLRHARFASEASAPSAEPEPRSGRPPSLSRVQVHERGQE
ncbi:MAG: tetratricopeptide repeat protein [Polyangiaceae bacterium]|nr:tetratricopeptide repeat protein [Polyangiaceae bacterium]